MRNNPNISPNTNADNPYTSQYIRIIPRMKIPIDPNQFFTNPIKSYERIEWIGLSQYILIYPNNP